MDIGHVLEWFFLSEFDGDVCFVIRVTIYGNTSKHTRVIYVLEQFFKYGFDVCFVIGVTIYGNTSKHVSVIYVLARGMQENCLSHRV